VQEEVVPSVRLLMKVRLQTDSANGNRTSFSQTRIATSAGSPERNSRTPNARWRETGEGMALPTVRRIGRSAPPISSQVAPGKMADFEAFIMNQIPHRGQPHCRIDVDVKGEAAVCQRADSKDTPIERCSVQFQTLRSRPASMRPEGRQAARPGTRTVLPKRLCANCSFAALRERDTCRLH